jgi:hypothetical protein
MLTRRVGRSKDGHDIVWTPKVLPLFKIRLDKISEFVNSIRRDAEQSDPRKPPIAPFPNSTSSAAAG